MKKNYKKGKSFAYYCSDGASRILKFYSIESNHFLMPEILIYDGDKKDVIVRLEELFGSRLFLIDKRKLTINEQKRIHSYTSEFIHKLMKKYNVEYLICFGNKILKKKFIDKYQRKIINFHPSLLPSFKGLKAIDQALNSKVSIIGNTAHYIDEGVDTGEIILQSAMISNDFESYEDVLELQIPMLKTIFKKILKYDISEECMYKELKDRKIEFLLSSL